MKSTSIPVISGLAVLVAGLIAFGMLTRQDPLAEATTTSTAAVVATTTASTEPVAFSGLDPSIERVLLQDGGAAFITDPGLAGIPPAVTRVLESYQAPLMVPRGDGG